MLVFIGCDVKICGQVFVVKFGTKILVVGGSHTLLVSRASSRKTFLRIHATPHSNSIAGQKQISCWLACIQP